MSKLWAAVSATMLAWHQAKLFIEHSVAVSHDSLHVIVGVLAWLVIAFIARRPLTALTPWLWLLALIGWNEAADLWLERWPDAGAQYGEGAKDVLLTMLLPTVLMWAARMRPDLFRPTARRRPRRSN